MSATTITAPTTTYRCTVNHRPESLTITGPDGVKSCRINLTVTNSPLFTLTQVESDLIDSVKMAVAVNSDGKEEFTFSELKTLAGIRDRANSWTPPAQPSLPVPMILPLTSLANHTVTVTYNTPQAAPQPTGRKRVKNDTNAFIYQEVTSRSRRYGVDDLERRINALKDAAETVSQDMWQMTYDIPSAVRDVTPEPTGFLWCYGFPMTESAWVFTGKNIEKEGMQRFLDYYREFPGVTITLVEVHYKQVQAVRDMVGNALMKLLRETHGTLIRTIDEADKRLTAAMKEAETDRAMLEADRQRDNKVRSAIRAAADDLNLAVMCAEEYDASEQTIDLLKGLRAAIASSRAAFNARAATKENKTVEV